MNMKYCHRLMLSCVLAVFMASPHASANGVKSEPVEATLQPRKSLHVVTDDNFPPYIFRTADGKIEGLTVELWNLF